MSKFASLATCLTLLLPLLPVDAPQRVDESYFPDLAFDPSPDRHRFINEWYSKQLRAMGEPSLWAKSRADRAATVYRLLWVPSFCPAVAVRIVETPQSVELHATRLTGRGGYEPGSIAASKRISLAEDQQAELERRLADARFWSMSTNPPEDPNNPFGVEDGDQLIFEGIKDGEYHVVDRRGLNEGDYFHLCHFVISKLSPIDVAESWGEYHIKAEGDP